MREAQAIIATVGNQFKPLGVTRVLLLAPDEHGDAPIIVEMSPGDEVAHLTMGGVINQRPTVMLKVELTVGPEGEEGKGNVVGTVAVPDKPKRRDNREYEFLPAVLDNARTRTPTTANKAVGGILFLPPGGGSLPLGGKLQLMTWNTSTMDIAKLSNTTHAERQFIKWLEAMEKDTEGKRILQRVTRINAALVNLSPCGACGDILRQVKEFVPKAKLHLTWSKFYSGVGVASPTNAHTLEALASGGWECAGPTSAEEESQKVHIDSKPRKH